MDMLDRFVGHDAAETRALLVLSRGLGDEQLDRPLDIDHGSLRASLHHVVAVMEKWTDLMLGRTPRFHARPPDSVPTVEQLLQRFDTVASDFAALARRVQADGCLEETFVDWDEEPPRKRTLGAGIGHVITHNGSHRAHLAAMLTRLGVPDVPEGDLLGWERRLRGGWEPAPLPSAAEPAGDHPPLPT
jgi:uncharacterized damage-inducible protein DinB